MIIKNTDNTITGFEKTLTPIGQVLDTTNASGSLDTTKSGLYHFTLAGNNRTLTVTNENSLGLGYKFSVAMYAEGGEDMTVTGGFISLTPTGLAAGVHHYELTKILNYGDVIDWAISSYVFTSA